MGVRLLVLVVLSVALMVVDARFALLKPVRSQMSLVLMQTYWIIDLPQRLYQGVASQFGSRAELEPPLFCTPSRALAWQALCPSPATLLGLDRKSVV